MRFTYRNLLNKEGLSRYGPVERIIDWNKKIEEKYESSLRNPVTDVEISKLQLDIQKKLGNIELPKSYVVFLITVNGLDFNELVIYGVHEHLLVDQEVEDLQGFVDTNVFFTSLVNLFFYSGGLIGWTYYSFNADSGWDIEL